MRVQGRAEDGEVRLGEIGAAKRPEIPVDVEYGAYLVHGFDMLVRRKGPPIGRGAGGWPHCSVEMDSQSERCAIFYES